MKRRKDTMGDLEALELGGIQKVNNDGIIKEMAKVCFAM
jgi:hypothetical protein